ncbi:MAG: hypothetical protein R2730_00300 [Chitinophagales bacterium]
MASNTVVLSQHHLNFDSPKELMQKVSEILNANVILGFEAYIDCSEHLEIIQWGDINYYSSHDCYVLDKLIKDPQLHNVIILYDDDYIYTWLIEKYGEKAGDLPDFKALWTNDPVENLDIIQSFANRESYFELYTKDFAIDICRAVIRLTNDNTHDKYGTLLDWVIGNLYDPEELIPAFDENKAISQLFGGSGVYYINDSSSYLDLGQLQEINMTWEEVLFEMTKKIKPEDIINMRKCIYDETYLSQVKNRVGERYSENWRKFPVLYDDFKEYKTE